MKQRHQSVGLKRLCGLFGKTRQAFYEHSWQIADQQVEQGFIVSMIGEHRKLMPGIGGVKLHKLVKAQLTGHSMQIGRDRFFRLLRDHDLLIRRKRHYAVTTQSQHHYYKWPDLTAGLSVQGPNRLWVSDITYLRTLNGFNYLSLITDGYSRKIVGYHLSQQLKAQGPIIALKKAIKSLDSPCSLIHHSDRGIQYCCQEYVSLLQDNNINISMTQSGSPYENAIAERVNGILKKDMGLERIFEGYGQAVEAVSKAIDTYNRLRPHMSCNYLTPNEAHHRTGPLNKKWKHRKKARPILQP